MSANSVNQLDTLWMVKMARSGPLGWQQEMSRELQGLDGHPDHPACPHSSPNHGCKVPEVNHHTKRRGHICIREWTGKASPMAPQDPARNVSPCCLPVLYVSDLGGRGSLEVSFLVYSPFIYLRKRPWSEMGSRAGAGDRLGKKVLVLPNSKSDSDRHYNLFKWP